MKDKFSIGYQQPRTDGSATDGWQADICKSGFEDCLWNNKQFKTTITTVRIRLCFCSVLWSIKSFASLAYNGPVHHIWFLRFGSQKQYKASLSLIWILKWVFYTSTFISRHCFDSTKKTFLFKPNLFKEKCYAPYQALACLMQTFLYFLFQIPFQSSLHISCGNPVTNMI